MADDRITRQVVEYFTDLKYEDLPEDVVHTAKRIFMDIVGCGLGSHPLDKGATAVKLVKAKGGAPEATILGTGEKLPMDKVAIAAGKQMGFNKEQMTNAFGLSGYFAPIPCLMKYMHTANNGMHAVKKL